MSRFRSFNNPTIKDNNPKIKINKKNLGKIARNKSRVWFWSKYLNTAGAIIDVCNRIMPQIIPEVIDSKWNVIFHIRHKTKLNPKLKSFDVLKIRNFL